MADIYVNSLLCPLWLEHFSLELSPLIDEQMQML